MELQPVVTRDEQDSPSTDKVAVKDFWLHLVFYCDIIAHFFSVYFTLDTISLNIIQASLQCKELLHIKAF